MERASVLWVLCERGRENGGREPGEAVGPDLPIEVYVQEPGAGIQEMWEGGEAGETEGEEGDWER